MGKLPNVGLSGRFYVSFLLLWLILFLRYGIIVLIIKDRLAKESSLI